MIKILPVLIIIFAVIAFSACYEEPPKAYNFISNSISSYRDIPGITAEEIEAIEAVKQSRSKIIYGSMPSTEAFRMPDGSYNGFSAMFNNLLSELFDIPFVLSIHDWTELKNGIDDKIIDFTGEMTPTPERQLIYHMSYPIAERGLSVFTRNEVNDFYLDNLRGLKIGFYKGTITAESVLNAYPDLVFEIADVYDYQDVYSKLMSGEIKAFIADATEAYSYREHFNSHNNIFALIHTPVSMTTANPEFAPFISVINKYIKAGGIDELYDLYAKGIHEYSRFKFFNSLNDAEKKYLDNLFNNNANVKIAIESDNYPISFYNENEKEFQGIALDVLSEITFLTGINFENASKKNDPWVKILEMLSSGETPMITELLFSEERKDRFLWTDQPYAVNRYALVSKSDFPFLEAYQVVRSAVGVMGMTGREHAYRALFPNNENLKTYDFQIEAFDALERGEVDLVMSTEYDFLTLTNYLEKPGYKLNIIFNTPLVESFFGFNINERILRSIISKAINHIDAKRIEKDWVNRTFNYERMLAEERSFYANQRVLILSISAVILFLFIIMLILLLIKNDRIKKLYIDEIEEKKEMEKAIIESNERLMLMLDTSPLCAQIWDRNLNTIDCNEAGVRLYGFKDKKEYRERFITSCSPEYQPDGQRSDEKAVNLVHHAFNEGYCKFDWMHKMPDDETPIPAEVSLVRAKYGSDYVVVGYTRDLREHNKLMEEVKNRERKLEILNKAAIVFTAQHSKSFEDIMTDGLWPIINELDLDRLSVWRNFSMPDGLHVSQFYRWDKKTGVTEPRPEFKDVLYTNLAPRWEGLLARGDNINSPANMLPEADLLKRYGIVSVFVTPIFIDNSFWGFVLFEDRRNERNFDDNSIDIMRSVAFMSVNAVLRNQLINKNLSDTAMLEDALNKMCEATESKNNTLIALENILNSIEAGIYVTVPDTGEILFANNFLKKFLEIEGDVIGKYCYKIFRKNSDNRCDFCPCYKLEKEPDKVFVWEEYEPNTGATVLHSDCLINWHDGRKVHLQHVMDITELVTAKQLAEQSNRAKGIFLAQMSHEIRTPMNAILGISEIFLQNKDSSANGAAIANVDEGFRKIYESGSLLLNIINDILDFSKIEAGKLEIIPKKYEIPTFINDTVQINRIRYENKPIEFNLNLDENTPLEVIGDELRIRQILNNLLSNAFKYTETGKVEFSVSFEKGKDENSVILIYKVNDTGQGMNDDQLNRLFSEYERFNMDTNHGISGTGLGMSITKNLIELMNGEILVESDVGKGSLFTVRIPHEKCNPLVCGREIADSLHNFSFRNTTLVKNEQIIHEYMPDNKILVVDDVESNLYVAKGLLLPYGMFIETAKNGLEAIEKIKNNGEYDVVFMDHMMPKMNGMKATEIIRGMGYIRPIIALTANVISGQEEIYLSNGFDGFLAKPIDSRELDILLRRFILDKGPFAKQALSVMHTPLDESEEEKNVKMAEIKKYFLIDAENAISILNDLFKRLESLDDKDMELYTVTVHGIKTVLANINEKNLSETASKMEQAGYNRNFAVITNETPVFIDALQQLLDKFKAEKANNVSNIDISYDADFLKEKLNEILTESGKYNINAVKTALTELRQKTWTQNINDIIEELSLNVLHGKFKNVISIAQKTLEEHII